MILGSPLDPPELDLTIAIVNWNTLDLLRGCLASIQAEADGLDLEITVVDNASWDGSAGMVTQEFPRVKLIANKQNRGFARANNQAVHGARGRHVLLLNPDTVVLPGALRRMVKFLDDNHEAGAVACRLLNSDGTLQYSLRRFPTLLTPFTENPDLKNLPPIRHFTHQYRLQDWSHGEISQVDQPMGAALMVRRGVVETLGLFDEAYHMFFEDVDLCFRIKKNGWEIYYLPEAEIIHYGGQSVRQSQKAGEHFYRSLLLYYERNNGRFQTVLVRLSMILGSLANILVATALLPLRSRAATEVIRASLKICHFGLIPPTATDHAGS